MDIRRMVLMTAMAVAVLMTGNSTRGDDPVERPAAAPLREIPIVRGTAREQLAAFEESAAQGVTPATNAAEHLFVYLTQPDFRDQRYRDKLEAIGIETPVQDIPYFEEWFSFHYRELDDSREGREQYAIAQRSVFDPDTAPQVARWLEEVGPALDAMREAVALPHFWIPHLSEERPETTFLREMQDFRYIGIMLGNIVDAFLVRCHYNLGIAGNSDALADLVAADRLAKLFSHVLDSWFLEESYEFGYTLNRTLELLLTSRAYQDEQLATLSAQWERPQTGFTPAQVIDQWERLWMIDYFERVASGAEEEPSFFLHILSMGHPPEEGEAEGWDWMMRHELFDPRRAVARVDARYDWLVESIGPEDFTSRKAAAAEAVEALRGRMGNLEFDWRAFDRIYQEQVMPEGMTQARLTDMIVDVSLILLMHPNRVLDNAIQIYAAEAARRMGTAAIALASYQMRHDTYPVDLEALVPDYLSRVPSDPYRETHPIGYRLTDDGRGFLLHCVGMDEADNGGEGDDRAMSVGPAD